MFIGLYEACQLFVQTRASGHIISIVSSRTHGLFVHLSQSRNVGKTLIYAHKRIKNTEEAYNDIPTLHHGTARFARVTKRSVNADYPSLTLHRRQTDPSGW